MWKEELPSGKVRFVERYRNPLTLKNGYVSVTMEKDTRSTRKLAEAAIQKKIEEKMRAARPEAKRTTLEEIYRAYTAYQEKTLKPSTVDRNRRVLRICVQEIGPDVLASRLTAAAVRASLPPNPATYNERLTRIKAMLRWAYENDMIADVRFLDKLKPLKDGRMERIEDKYMEAGEVAEVLGAMKIERWKLLTEFLCLSGLRIGELIALLDEDVDLDRKTITISKTFTVNIHVLESSAKTESSNRIVTIQDELLPVCRQIRTYMRKQALIFGYRSPLFFPETDGTYLHYDSYRQYFGDTTEAVLGRRLTPHACRHTMTSLMAAAGVPIDVVSRRLGHADSAVTKRIYFHITDRMRERDAGAVQVRILT